MTISVGPYGLRCDLPPRELRPSQRSGCEPGILKSVPRPRLDHRALVANLNSRAYPCAPIVVPDRLPPSPITTRRWNDVDGCRSVIARLCNRSTEQGPCRETTDNACRNLPIFRLRWPGPSNQCSRTNRQQ
jgi:hypothetical protein